MEIITVEHVKKYNQRMLKKYDQDVEAWKKEDGQNIIPQIAFYLFYTEQGDERQTGYIASIERGHYWSKTKKEAIARAEKAHF